MFGSSAALVLISTLIVALGDRIARSFSLPARPAGGYAVPCPCRRIPSLDFNWRHISYRLADVQHFVERGWLVSPVHSIL